MNLTKVIYMYWGLSVPWSPICEFNLSQVHTPDIFFVSVLSI
jgi:hypothetical protein